MEAWREKFETIQKQFQKHKREFDQLKAEREAQGLGEVYTTDDSSEEEWGEKLLIPKSYR